MSSTNGDTLELIEFKGPEKERKWSRIRFPSVGDVVDEEAVAASKKEPVKTEKKKRPESRVSVAVVDLHRASQSGDLEEIQRVLRKGVDVNEADEYGKTALHNAVVGNYLECVNVLLSEGANVQTSDETGETPIHSATRNGNEAIVTVLLKQGNCNVNVRNEENTTPFHIAADIDHLVICKMLIEASADLNPRANDGTTPIAKAATMGNEKIVDYILTVAGLIRADLNEFLYDADKDGSSLLQLAVNGGSKQFGLQDVPLEYRHLHLHLPGKARPLKEDYVPGQQTVPRF